MQLVSKTTAKAEIDATEMTINIDLQDLQDFFKDLEFRSQLTGLTRLR
jgi:hypothetical protein